MKILNLLFVTLLVLLSVHSVYAAEPSIIYAKSENDHATIMNYTIDMVGTDDDNDPVQLSYSTTNGTITTPYPYYFVGETFVTVSSDGYETESFVVNAPNSLTAYLPPTGNTSLIVFSLIDYSNDFKYSSTRLVITQIKDLDVGTVSDKYFDSSGTNSMRLTTGETYTLYLINGENVRSLGPFTPKGNEALSLVVSDIQVLPYSEAYGGFNSSIVKTNESVTLVWSAPEGVINSLNLSIYASNGALVHRIISFSDQGTSTFIYPDQTKQYKLILSVDTPYGFYKHSEYIRGETDLIDLDISDHWSNILSIFFLVTIGLLFGAKSAPVGAFSTAIFGTFLYGIGLLRVDLLIISLIMILGVIAILRGRR